MKKEIRYPQAFPRTTQGFPMIDALEEEVTADAWCAHQKLDQLLAKAGTASDQLLRQHMWQRDKRFFPILERVRKFWQPEAAPSSGLGVASLRSPVDSWFGLEGIAADIAAANCPGPRRMLKPADDSANPSTSIYSRMVASGPMVFLAGHIPIRTTEEGQPVVARFEDVPEEGRFLATGRSHPDSRDGPIAAQTWFVYNEIRRALENQGMYMSDVVHMRVFLADFRDLATFHRVHQHFYPKASPALQIVKFSEVGHKGCLVEVEPTALMPGTPRHNVPWSRPAPFAGPAAVRAGPLILLAGVPGIGPDGRIAKDSASTGRPAYDSLLPLEPAASTPSLPAQVWWAWRRVQEILDRAGTGGLGSIVKTVVYLRSEADFPVYELVRAQFLPDDLPAFDCVIVPGPGPTPESDVQLDVTAVCD